MSAKKKLNGHVAKQLPIWLSAASYLPVSTVAEVPERRPISTRKAGKPFDLSLFRESVPGLECIREVISGEEERQFLRLIDAVDWQQDLKRRVQHYGYRYDYNTRSISQDDCLGPFPVWLKNIIDRLREGREARMVGIEQVKAKPGYLPFEPDQIIVNEYQPGQGIAAHIDCTPCFGDTIVALSLGSGCTMQFKEKSTGALHSFYMPSRSMLIMCGEARYKWQHGIPARKYDSNGGMKIPRMRRVSITFRQVVRDSAGEQLASKSAVA